MKAFGITIMAFSVFLFYLIFFKFAPYIDSLIPNGDRNPILKFIVYVLVVWLGEIAIPLIILTLGFCIFITNL